MAVVFNTTNAAQFDGTLIDNRGSGTWGDSYVLASGGLQQDMKNLSSKGLIPRSSGVWDLGSDAKPANKVWTQDITVTDGTIMPGSSGTLDIGASGVGEAEGRLVREIHAEKIILGNPVGMSGGVFIYDDAGDLYRLEITGHPLGSMSHVVNAHRVPDIEDDDPNNT